ncbi:MAG: ethylbenzene dehydrogenase-related protein [Sulfuricaulis sp.]|nr:ethylbenzene dehydrogenase-related protein [Sulfuricaulis sp.]
MRKSTQVCLLAVAMLASLSARAEIEVRRVAADALLLDPAASFWNAMPPLTVPMLPQVVTVPRHPNNAVKEIKVRAVHDGRRIAFHLEWQDATRSDRIVVDQFGDQVAVEMPVKFNKDALPSPMMGNPGGRVDIWQWRAAFQRDLDEGEPKLRDLYPYAQVDGYPDEVLRATDARPYTGALGVDNPISHPLRTPVLDQSAEGWGTMTVEPDGQDADGRGVWEDGTWRVVIAHPMTTALSENDIHLFPGEESIAAFAVWDGGHREVGSRKAWSNWIPLRLQK